MPEAGDNIRFDRRLLVRRLTVEGGAVTDPGWDIPGIPREAALAAGVRADGPASACSAPDSCESAGQVSASSASGSRARRRKPGRKARSGSISACAGLSAGAFARLADGPRAAAGPASSRDIGGESVSSSPSSAAAGGTCGIADSQEVGSHGAAAAGSASADTDGCGATASARSSAPAGANASGAIPSGAIPSGTGPAGTGSSGTGPVTAGVRVTDPVQALALLSAALDFLAHGDAGEWAEGVQADCLRALAVAESQQTAAHARVLRAFSVPGGGLAGDGHRSPRVWLTWQTQATRRWASGKVGWMRRLDAHPVVAGALAGGSVSPSWAAQIIAWTDRLPDDYRDAADGELLAAAAAGASLGDLALIAEELHREHAEPDEDDDDGFTDRSVRLATTFGGAGRLEGDLTPRCAAATGAVLGALSQPFGPEDTRTAG